MGGVSRDQIERARKVDVLDFILRHEHGNIKRVGSAYRMLDHPSIEIKRGKWRWYSQGLYGKTALDFLVNVRGYDLVGAVSLLLGEQPCGAEYPYRSGAKPHGKVVMPKENSQPERQPLIIPRHNKDNSRVIAYLQSRGIEKGLILDCIGRGDLFESVYYHNCVFIGRDNIGKIKYAAIRSTSSGYKGDAAGSDKKFCFLLPPTDPDSNAAAIFEAPIDALSHMTMCNKGYIPQFEGWRLCLGGTSISGLEYFLENHSQVTDYLICTDMDEAGDRTAGRIAGISGITTERSVPVIGTDWNEALNEIQELENRKSRINQHDIPCL